jgi:hypothetical protein
MRYARLVERRDDLGQTECGARPEDRVASLPDQLPVALRAIGRQSVGDQISEPSRRCAGKELRGGSPDRGAVRAARR